ncbi:MAG: UDP-GlcNAc:undecaprenyl-phosphate GlcNAc-1-phosphate transferase [Arenicella sp.]
MDINYNAIIPAFMISFLITFSVIPLIISYSKKKKLLDVPGGRKIHTISIPSLGGVGIFVGFIASMIMWSDFEQLKAMKFVYVGILMVVFTGIRDDLLPMRALSKLVWQITAALTVVHFAEIRLTSLHGLFFIEEIPVWMGYMISVFTIIVITNSFNLIDGLNGLAGSISIIVLLAYGVWFYLYQDIGYVILITGLIGGILAFLKYNYTPAQIFMGDTGSLLIGFIISVITIKFIETNSALPAENSLKFTARVAMPIAILIYPLFDTIRIFVLRLMQKRSPFSPDKSHIHHLVMRLGFSHLQTTFILCGLNITVILSCIALKEWGNAINLSVTFVLCLAFAVVLDYRLSKAFPKKTNKIKIFK